MRWRSFFFRVSSVRAAGEAITLAIALWLLLWALHNFVSPALFPSGLNKFSPSVLTILLGVLISVCCACYYAARARLSEGSACQSYTVDALIAGSLLIMLCGIGLLFTFAIYQTVLPAQRIGGEYVPAQVAGVTFLLDATALFVLRIGIRLLRYWNRLRRTQLLWALTHAHLVVVLLGAGMLMALLTFVVIVSGRTDFTVIVPTLIGMLILTAIALAIVLPPSALFSYIVMRRTTNRLRILAAATSALRGGRYAVRVPVEGEDEVAQLQNDFNVMAADLERTMRALQGERDLVAGLLQSRRELIASVSHELRTPIATLRGYLETTLTHWEESRSSTLHQDLQVMESEVIRLQRLVEDLFTLSRAEVGKLVLQCKPTAVGPLVERIVATAAPLVWRSGKIELIADIPACVPIVSVDPDRLEQALQNLLHNAVRHTSPGGIIVMGVAVEPGTVALQVKDTGEGIDADDLPRIWERFYQTKNAQANAGGAGLGLALVKEWIEAMGGMVSVQSVVGEGSCFTIHLPRADYNHHDNKLFSE